MISFEKGGIGGISLPSLIWARYLSALILLIYMGLSGLQPILTNYPMIYLGA